MVDIKGGRTGTILVVEDEASIVKLCCRTLGGGGFEVDVAANGKAAQGMVDKKGYTLCLVDIRTPEMSGIEFFQWLAGKHPEMANRVIFTTGDVVGGNTTQFIEQSGKPLLPKPFTPEELQAIVSETLERIGEG